MQSLSVSASLMRAHGAGDAAQVAAMQALRAEITRRDDRIAELEGLLGLRVRLLPSVRMTPTGRLIFGILLQAQGWTSTESMVTAIWGALPECDWPRNPYGSLKVHVCNLREALRPHGVEFDTIFAAGGCGGYFMPLAMKALAKQLIIGGATC